MQPHLQLQIKKYLELSQDAKNYINNIHLRNFQNKEKWGKINAQTISH